MRLPKLKFYQPRQEELDDDEEELDDDEEEDDREDEGEELDDDDDEDESKNENGNGNGQGPGGNNNGPPGSEGSPQRPSRRPGPPNTVTSTELSPSPSTSALPLETAPSGLPPPKEIVTSTTSSSSTAIDSRTAEPSSTSPVSTISTSIALPPPETTTSPVVSQSEDASSTSLSTLSPPTSVETTQASLGDTTIPVLDTATSSTATSSTTLPLAIGFATPNDTAIAVDAATNPVRASHVAGIAVGSIAGFAFLLTFIVLFYKWHKRTLLKTPSSSIRRLSEKWRVSTWTPRPRSPDAMENSLLASEERSGEGILSNSQPIFEKPPVPQTLRQSFHNSITRLVRMNPLALHPAMSGAPGSASPRPKSFVSSIFRRYSAASSYTARSEHSVLPDQLQADPLPPIPSAYLKQGQHRGSTSV